MSVLIETGRPGHLRWIIKLRHCLCLGLLNSCHDSLGGCMPSVCSMTLSSCNGKPCETRRDHKFPRVSHGCMSIHQATASESINPLSTLILYLTSEGMDKYYKLANSMTVRSARGLRTSESIRSLFR
jgi:hypothetical protein